MPTGKQDALGFCSCAVPLFAEAVGEGLFLLCGLKFRQQQGVAYADFLGIEGLDHSSGKLRQFESCGAIGRRFTRLCGDLLNAVLRFLQVEQGFESLSFLQRVDVSPLKIFDLSLVLQKLSMTSTTMESCTL